MDRTSLAAPPFSGEANTIGDMGLGYVTFDLPDKEGTYEVRVINATTNKVLDYKKLSVTMINAPKVDEPPVVDPPVVEPPVVPAPTASPTATVTAPVEPGPGKPAPVKPGKPGLPKSGR